jgi:N-methylhydantoinase B
MKKSKTKMNHADPATLAVLWGWLQQITNEMDEVVCLSAFSPTISEGYDRASGIYTKTGKMVVQGKTSLPIFILTMQDAVEVIIEAFKEELFPDDIILYNDPYRGGTHLMDVKVFKPFFRGGKLAYWLASSGHWPDVGGAAPGGFVPGATEIFQEGLRFPPVKIYEKGKLNDALLTVLLANVRIPEERYGDLQAQIGSLRVGEERLNAVLDKYGDDTLEFYISEMIQRSEQHMRSYIKEIPDGIYSATEWMDNDGIEDVPVKIALDVVIEGDSMTFDFSKSSPPVRGPVNAGISVAKSGVYTFLMHTFSDIPINSGIFNPTKFIWSKQTFLNASHPRPVSGAAAEVTQRIYDICSIALSKVLPKRIPANPFGTINNTGIGGIDSEGKDYIMYVFTGGGYGGYDEGDGFPYGAPPVGTSRVQPYEVFEQLYPIRTRCFSLREKSGGIGKYRGGLGAVIEIELLEEEARVGFMGDRVRFGPQGVHGGGEGTKNEVYIVRKNGEIDRLPLGAKGSTIIHKGDVISIHTPGGGGYGVPHERDRELILKDIINEIINVEEAERDYNIGPVSEVELDAIRRKM